MAGELSVSATACTSEAVAAAAGAVSSQDRLAQLAGGKKILLMLDEVQELAMHPDGGAVAAALRASFQRNYSKDALEQYAKRLGVEKVTARAVQGAVARLRDEQLKTLDQNVTVIDPREAEAAFRRELRDVRTKEDAERIASESLERRLKSKEDVPMVEDLPLAPEEETPEFIHLTTTLKLRLIRAMEHWRGNTDLTLAALIVRTVKEGFPGGAIR